MSTHRPRKPLATDPAPAASPARAELDQILARYDHGALPPGIAARVAALQRELAWEEHRRASRSGGR